MENKEIKKAIGSVFGSIEEQRQATGYYKNLPRYEMEAAPMGKESLEGYPSKKGDTIISSGKGILKAGKLETTLKEVYQENGYFYYVCENGMTLRQKDISCK